MSTGACFASSFLVRERGIKTLSVLVALCEKYKDISFHVIPE